jgi:tetratricopeptide (TPR) repeat protein
MLAFYRDGQQAAALATYQHARRTLVDELATEPGPELRQLEQQILAADPVLSTPALTQRRDLTEHGSLQPAQHLAYVPRQLPVAVRHFTGRVRELMTLTRMSGPAAGGAMICVISGTAGVGKTALTVHWSHMAASRFPDGQLFADLRGYDPAGPVRPADALARLLRGLGVPGQNIPSELDELAGQFRSVLADRRVLVVLDNAASADQVRPLLPGGPGCAVLITSRDSLPGLVAADGAQRLDLDTLPLADAVEVLSALVGRRVRNEPRAAETLAAQCARLPLALRLTAELAASRPDQRLADLAADLANERQRLELLDADGDTRAGLRAVFWSSYQSLDAASARAFRLAGLVPGPDFGVHALAALTGVGLGLAQAMLERLADSGLLHPAGPGRYAMHDLLRAYARELAGGVSPAGELPAAMAALFDHYLHTAAAATGTLFPADASSRPYLLARASPVPPVATHDQARAWLDAERANLVAAAGQMACAGWHSYVTRLGAILVRYLDVGRYYQEAITIHGHASRAAALAGDLAAEAEATRSLGIADFRQSHFQRAACFLLRALALFQELGDVAGQARALHDLSLIDFHTGRRYAQATDQLERALAHFRAIGDQFGQARALGNLGLIDIRQGRYRQARHNLRQALELYQSIGDRPGQARALSNLGVIEARHGRWPQARGYLSDALVACREIGDRAAEADVLRSLGVIDSCLGNHARAVSHLQHALALSTEIGERRCQGWALTGLGLVSLRQRQLPQATGFLQQAIELYQATGDEAGEAEALNGLGEVLLASGEPEDASVQHLAALSRAERRGERDEFARAHYGVACAYRETGKLDQARYHLKQALDVFRDLGAPEADAACTQLAQLDKHLGIGSGDAARGPLAARPWIVQQA